MKKNLLIYLLVVVVVVVAVVLVISFYFTKQNAGSIEENEKSADQIVRPDALFISDDFTILPPSGWVKSEFPNALVYYKNPNDQQPIGSAAEKINFQTYFAISADNLKGKTLTEITEFEENQIKAVVPGVVFKSTTDGKIDGQPAKFFEADLSMKNVGFKLMVAVIAKGDKYFTISNNTTAQKWLEYRDIFYNTADTFRFKY